MEGTLNFGRTAEKLQLNGAVIVTGVRGEKSQTDVLQTGLKSLTSACKIKITKSPVEKQIPSK